MVLFGDMLGQSASSWMPQGGMGAIGRGISNGFQQLGQSMGQSLASWRPGGQQPRMAPDMMAGWSGQSGGQPGGMGQYLANNAPGVQQYTPQNAALSRIGDFRQRAADASRAGRPLSYFELQEGNAQAFDDYKRNLDWNNTAELDLAKVMDGRVKARAAKQNEQDRMDGGGGVNFNWRAVANNLQAQDGLGFTRAVEGGGRALFADGNQQSQFLDDAAAEGVQVSGDLRKRANFMRDVWNQQDEISGGDNDSRSWLKTGSVYGPKAYKSMGMSGNNTDVAFGTDQPYDPRNGANGMERADALGAKDWQWQKFHNSNVSYGGGNYVGSSPQQDQNRLSWHNMPKSWGRAGVFPPGSEFYSPNGAGGRDDAAWQRQQNPEGIVPGATYPKGWQAPVYDYGGQVIRSGINGIGFGGAVGAPGTLSMGPDVFDQGNYGTTSVQAPVMSSSERMLSQYRNMADGFDGGYYGAQTGAYSGLGNYRPRSFWMTK